METQDFTWLGEGKGEGLGDGECGGAICANSWMFRTFTQSLESDWISTTRGLLGCGMKERRKIG